MNTQLSLNAFLPLRRTAVLLLLVGSLALGSRAVSAAPTLTAAAHPSATAVQAAPEAAPIAPAVRARPAVTARKVDWSKTSLVVAGSLPIQDGGRVKPLSTFANFTLLRLNGKSTAKDQAGEKLDSMRWLLDTFVDPRRSGEYPIFQVQDSATVHAIGLEVDTKKKRDRWSFAELRPAVPKLFDLAHEYSQIEGKNRTTMQAQVVMLAEAVDIYLGLAGFLDFARMPIPLSEGGILAQEFGTARLNFSDLVRRGGDLSALRSRLEKSDDPLEREASRELASVLRFAADLGRASLHVALQPPDAVLSAREAWHTPGELLSSAFDGMPATAAELAGLVALERLGASLGSDNTVDMAEAEAALVALDASTGPIAAARGETRRLDLEVTYYRLDLLMYALAAYILAFVLAAFSWLRPAAALLPRLTFGAATVGTLLMVVAITLRCIIRERPPVSTLYETLLFVTATGAIIGLSMELINRRRIALYATAALGMVGMFLSNGYETLDKRDTMPSLVAVLDTNFWLATHVTVITIGYAAGVFAALLGSVYIVVRLIRGRASAPEFFTSLGRMIYGTLAFGLVFSLVGTILGGIWANDSWGRFWGWDPKENGALLICISQVAILHARLGGILRELGIAAAACFAGTIVAFSWFGTNLLGVGLHSYGFTEGINSALWTYYGIQWSICALALVVGVREASMVKSQVSEPPATSARGRTTTPAT